MKRLHSTRASRQLHPQKIGREVNIKPRERRLKRRNKLERSAHLSKNFGMILRLFTSGEVKIQTRILLKTLDDRRDG